MVALGSRRESQTLMAAAVRGGSARLVLGESEESPCLQRARDQIAWWRASRVEVVTPLDEHYPAQLRSEPMLAPLLFYRGTLATGARAEPAVAVVGSRAASSEGLEYAHAVAARLAQAGVAVVSGMALGVDAAAHGAALSHGRTVAVLATGVDRFYPVQNWDLQERVAASGLVLSQFWPGSGPKRESFLARNGVVAAYCQVMVVVEAQERSGTRVAVREAVTRGRTVVLSRWVVAGTSWGRVSADHSAVRVARNAEHAVELASAVTVAQ